MAIAVGISQQSRRSPLQVGQIHDFSGGPNQRDDATEFARNEYLDSLNITLDERGAVASRLGYDKYNSVVYGSDLVINEYWSPLLGTLIVQAGRKLYKGTSNTVNKTFTGDGVATFAEINSLLVCAHPVDGIFTSPDGVTWTVVSDPDAPTTATCVAVWQNKVFVGQTTGKVSWSAPGDATAWTSTDFNKIWEKDQTGIIALHIASGQDILGRPGLMVFKQESTYRIDDSGSGAYVTIDATVGAGGPKCVIGVGPKVIAINKRGIYWWREDQQGFVNASDKLNPLWDPTQVSLANIGLWCAGRKGNRARFSLCRFDSSANDLAIEYHPDQGWLAPRTDAASCYATSTGSAEVLYGGSPTVAGQVWEMDRTGADNGTAISWRIQTRWIPPNSGFKAFLWQLRIHGRGMGTLTIRKDYASQGGTSRPFNIIGVRLNYDEGHTYDSGLMYDTGVSSQASTSLFSFGECRQFSLIFSGSSSTVAVRDPVLGAGVGPDIGYFGLSAIEYIFVTLGLA